MTKRNTPLFPGAMTPAELTRRRIDKAAEVAAMFTATMATVALFAIVILSKI